VVAQPGQGLLVVEGQVLAVALVVPVSEARAIADRLRCGPLLDRAADLTPAAPPTPAPTA
jgi:hypothetical protein